MSIFEIASLGVYGVLAILSLVALGIGLFKFGQFAKMGVGRRAEADKILDDWLNGRVDEAVSAAGQRKSVLSRILQAVFSGIQARPTDVSYAEELSRQTAMVELATMSEQMRALDMVVQAAPMLGLLGTVLGMIDAALSTTAAGLVIALFAFFIATWLEGRIDRERNMIEALMSAAIHGRVDPNAAN
jgi:biopolymer transport protein ExbB